MAMSQTRPRAPSWSLVMLLLCVFCLFAAPSTAAASSSAVSSQASSDLICHTSDPSECYSRLFVPTDEFQPVHEGQELPSGLHVRLNIWTGTKEAKINVPDEANPALDGLPVDQAVVVVDPDIPEGHQQQEQKPPVPKNAPKYEAVGKIKEPRHDAGTFADGMEMLRSGVTGSDEAFDAALETLEDLSHDIYYGLKITEDANVLRGLICLAVQSPLPSTQPDTTPRNQQAAAILAGALQNNPTALAEVIKAWPSLKDSTCPLVEGASSPAELIFSAVVPPSGHDAPANKLASNAVKARVAALNGLIRDDALRAEFLSRGGTAYLLEALRREGAEWAGAQRKVGQLVLDNFLDQDMGARPGQWPRGGRLADKVCKEGEEGAEPVADGCWDYYVERIMKANSKDKSHWSRDLHDRLAAARKAGDASWKHTEL